jgi:hypothetical protein
MKKMLMLAIALPLFFRADAQDLPAGFKNWFSLGTDIQVNKKMSLEFSHLTCFNTKPYEVQFSQLSAGMEYKLDKNLYLLGGVEQFHFRSGSDFELYHKLSTGILLRKIFDLPIKQSLEAEWFLPLQRKHRLRGVYTLSYSLKNDALPWKGRPFIKGQLYYYYGGRPLTYYGANGEVQSKQSPNDLHRYRLTGGIVFKPIKRWNMTLYYAWNKEFNTGLFDHRDLNIPNIDGTKTRAQFNNYSVLGLSFTYQIKLD